MLRNADLRHMFGCIFADQADIASEVFADFIVPAVPVVVRGFHRGESEICRAEHPSAVELVAQFSANIAVRYHDTGRNEAGHIEGFADEKGKVIAINYLLTSDVEIEKFIKLMK